MLVVAELASVCVPKDLVVKLHLICPHRVDGVLVRQQGQLGVSLGGTGIGSEWNGNLTGFLMAVVQKTVKNRSKQNS